MCLRIAGSRSVTVLLPFAVCNPSCAVLAVFDMKIPPEYSEFCFYSVYSRGSRSLHQNGAVFLDWFYALCFAAGAFSWGMFALFPASCSFHTIFLGYLADDPAGISGSQTIGWDVSCHNTSCSDHTAFSDGNAATNHYVGCFWIFRSSGKSGCMGVANVTFGPIITLSPIWTSHTSKQVKLKLAELYFPKYVLQP